MNIGMLNFASYFAVFLICESNFTCNWYVRRLVAKRDRLPIGRFDAGAGIRVGAYATVKKIQSYEIEAVFHRGSSLYF